MFLDFFDLHQQPFGVTPDPAYLYPSQTHCEALDALTEGIQSGRGFLALVAEPGMGKTTLLYQVLEALRDKARTAFLFQTQCSSREFFQYLLNELGVDSTGMGLVPMHNKLNEILFAEMLAGRRFVLIVDEAQNLDETVLETIRLLSNFETTNTKLLQIVLAGQPQLGEKLRQKQLAQLLQRLTVVTHLKPFSPEETAGYIQHRLKVAGYSGEGLFEPQAFMLIAQKSGGIPRNINRICYQALLEAHADGQHIVSAEIVARADRKLEVAIGANPAPATTPADLASAVVASAAPRTTQRALNVLRSRGWHLWTAVFLAAALCAGSAVPKLRKGMMQILHGRVSAASLASARKPGTAVGHAAIQSTEVSTSAAQAEDVDYRLQTQGIGEAADSSRADEPRLKARGLANVNAVQITSTDTDARVVVTLDDTVQYNSARISGPERIYFDLHSARLNPAVGQKTVPLEAGLVKWVRAAQNTDDVVRLVLDADGAKAYSAQLLSDPYRLVVDVHSQATSSATSGTSSDAQQHSLASIPSLANAAHQRPTLSRELGLKISRIVIDPGHGGSDTGAMGPHGLVEKNVCLDVALRLGKLIEQNIAGAEVIYTRKDDRYVPLEERTSIANKAHADLFISIHANSSDSSEVRGVETYYLNLATSPEAMKLATRENALGQSSLHDLPELIQKITRNEKMSDSKQLASDVQNALAGRLELVSRSETNRGVKQAPFVVLTGANMPAILSEISFLSNAKDESLLLQSSQRQRVAEGLYSGVAEYLDSLNSLRDKNPKLVTQNPPTGSSESAGPALRRNALKSASTGN
jgi:N-acetylmuramoyl-L-alanine amidase/type II secretory pathway predicted ATPase ExeA